MTRSFVELHTEFTCLTNFVKASAPQILSAHGKAQFLQLHSLPARTAPRCSGDNLITVLYRGWIALRNLSNQVPVWMCIKLFSVSSQDMHSLQNNTCRRCQSPKLCQLTAKRSFYSFIRFLKVPRQGVRRTILSQFCRKAG